MHDDDFCFECSEVDIVYNEGDALPDSSVDLTDEAKVFTFYNNSASSHLSNSYPASVEVDSLEYPSGEHAWRSLKCADKDVAERIRLAGTVEAAITISHTDGTDKSREDWNLVRFDILLKILRAKFQNRPNDAKPSELRDKLLE